MLTTMRRSYMPVAGVAGIALGTTLLSGCVSVARGGQPSEAMAPSAIAATSHAPRVNSLSATRLAVASHHEHAPKGEWSMPEAATPDAQRPTTKKDEVIGGSAKMFGAGDRGDIKNSGLSAVTGVAPGDGALQPAVFAERRASEALDRLAGTVTVRHEKRGAVITLSSDRLVDSGQWILTSSGQYNLQELAAGLRDQDGRAIRIQGYTDSMGTPAVNDALSLRRAEAVRDFLIKQGVAADSMRAEGLGAKRPVANNGTSEGRAQNRRIEIVIAPLE